MLVIKHKSNFITVLINLIVYGIVLVGISYIFSYQSGMPAYWSRIALGMRALVCALDIVYLLIFFLLNPFMDVPTAKILLCVFYALCIGLLLYSPGVIRLFDAVAWPLTYLVSFIHFKNNDYTSGFKARLTLCHMLCCISLIRTILTLSHRGTNPGPVYHAIVFLPIILLMCNKKEKVLLSVFACILVILTAKRTGLIALITGFTAFFLLNTYLQNTAKKKFRSIVLIALLGVALLFIASYYSDVTDKILLRFESISTDQGSGRLRIWQTVLSNYAASTPLQKIFGHGIHAVPNFVHPANKYIFSHNSYLEFLYDLGIVGVVLLALIVISMIVFLIRLIVEKNAFAPTAAFAVCIIIVFSATSYCFEESNYIMMIAFYLGLIRGSYYRSKHLVPNLV